MPKPVGCRENSTQKFGAVNSYFKKERYQINNLSVYLKELEKEGQSNLKANRRRQG